jgi:hypothetical protein
MAVPSGSACCHSFLGVDSIPDMSNARDRVPDQAMEIDALHSNKDDANGLNVSLAVIYTARSNVMCYNTETTLEVTHEPKLLRLFAGLRGMGGAAPCGAEWIRPEGWIVHASTGHCFETFCTMVSICLCDCLMG